MAPRSGVDPLRHHRRHGELHGVFGGDKFGQLAERFARFFGTPKFIIVQTLIVILWVVGNGILLTQHPFDPYPFILLNLCFSTQSAYAAPLILLAQTRQADRDKAAEEADANHREEIASEHRERLEQDLKVTQQIHKLQCEQMKILALLKGDDDGGPGSSAGGDRSSSSG